MQALEQLIYASVATQTFEVPQLAELLQKAQQQLQFAKKSGRNQAA